MYENRSARRSVLTGLAATGAAAMLPERAEAAAMTSLSEGFNSFNSTLWSKSSGYANGGAFNCGWRADHVRYNDGKMNLLLDNVPSSGKPYSSGEIKTRNTAHYGSYRVRMKPAKGSGLISSFFTYALSGNAEIDVEFLGKDTTRVEFNYYTNGVGDHETVFPLGFDASTSFHEYGFDWLPGSLTWFVDGKAVHRETGARGPLPTEASPIMMNLWAVNSSGSAWAGTFNYSGAKQARYDSVSFKAAPV